MSQKEMPREALKLPPAQMNWFAWQRAAGGGVVPVAFDEHPRETPSAARDLLSKTLRPIPSHLGHAALAELAEWAKGEAGR